MMNIDLGLNVCRITEYDNYFMSDIVPYCSVFFISSVLVLFTMAVVTHAIQRNSTSWLSVQGHLQRRPLTIFSSFPPAQEMQLHHTWTNLFCRYQSIINFLSSFKSMPGELYIRLGSKMCILAQNGQQKAPRFLIS